MNLTSKLSDAQINAAINSDTTGYLHTYVVGRGGGLLRDQGTNLLLFHAAGP